MSQFRFSIDSTLPRNRWSLNGEWRIAPGTDRAPGENYERSIKVPSVVDCATPALNGTEADYYWYQCIVEAENLSPNQGMWLRVEQAQFGTAVWVDGNFAGESIACYTLQEYRIDHLLVKQTAHTITIRVGARQTLPPEHAAGRDIEKEYFPPGVWGDVELVCSQVPRIKNIQVIQSLEREEAGVRVMLDAVTGGKRTVRLHTAITEWKSGQIVSESTAPAVSVGESAAQVMVFVAMKGCHAWHPDDPFLYVVTVDVLVDGGCTDHASVRFGMRDFSIRGSAFYLNGARIALKGGNIAFHRFLSDSERQHLPWDPAWVRCALIDIPRAHNFNFFRMHLGHAYNRWYDIADEGGMLLQDEWQFWNATGSNEVIENEFRQWVLDNANHPSIVIWDPLNESTDDSLIHDVVPALRELDPTRPWEAIDFHEQHPYIYSLGMTLNQRQFGHSAGFPIMERLREPLVVNEFLWWWFDSEWQPTLLMKDVIERWLGRSYSTQEVIEHQSMLAGELVELFRRMGCAAIQPFVYLSNNRGPTAHWFEGPLQALTPKPVLQALKNAYEPFGVSIELWDRHFSPGEKLSFPVHVFNDQHVTGKGSLLVTVLDSHGSMQTQQSHAAEVPREDRVVVPITLALPTAPGSYRVRAVLSGKTSAISERTIHIVEIHTEHLKNARPLQLLDPLQEVGPFLRRMRVSFSSLGDQAPQSSQLMFVNTFGLETRSYKSLLGKMTDFLDDGGVLVVQEPEFRTVEPKELRISTALSLCVERRVDVEKGGYDSYVFPEDPSHPLWRTLLPEHLRWFNGAPGGEIVSEHTITPSMPFSPLASCGLGLRVPAVLAITHGRGRVIVSRIQIRGRLDPDRKSSDDYARRFDPVAAQFLLNLLGL